MWLLYTVWMSRGKNKEMEGRKVGKREKNRKYN
jgi:hypothetical protein